MKIAYFDCQFGAAGDMLLAALAGAGLPRSEWLAALNEIALPKDSFKISLTETVRGTIAALKVDVSCAGEKTERHLCEIVEIIERSPINHNAQALAKRIFTALAEAERKVHGLPVDEVHFHEVGAIDAIVDIVGFAIAYDLMGIEKAYVSAVPLGSGTVKTEHGIFPVPGPAVLNLLSAAGAPTAASEIDYECLTPTGAAILTAVAASWGPLPSMRNISGIGYGAGTKDSPRWPNVVRVVVGELQDSAAPASPRFSTEALTVLEANLDDFSPQALSYALDRLLEAGALDAAVIPAVMKKGRSGHILSVLCKPEDREKLQELILVETSTLGVRAYEATRQLCERRWQSVKLSGGGSVRIKLAFDRQGHLINAAPEYEDCAEYATARSVPLKQVMQEAISRFQEEENGASGL